MIVVLDASAAVEVALNREDSGAFKDYLLRSDLVLAPDIYPSEVTNVFWKYSRYADYSFEKCEQGMAYCLHLVDDFICAKNLCREVLSASIQFQHPSYDLFYLILARHNNAMIITKDKKMIKLAHDMHIRTTDEKI